MHLGIGRAAHRNMVVPKLLEWLVSDSLADHMLEDDDGTSILPGYENAWWDEEVPVPVPIPVLQESAEEHLNMVESPVGTCSVRSVLGPDRHVIDRKNGMRGPRPRIPRWMK
jgi:hypothetical protein